MPGSSSRGSATTLRVDSPPAERPAFYALSPGGWRDLVTILHPPYTAWHLANVMIGAALAPTFILWRLAVALVAFFLALGIGCHALDELAGRPLGTQFSRSCLITLAGVGLGGAVALGILGAVVVSVWLVPLIIIGTFLALAYNLELFGGRFHTTFWMAVAWAGFPVLTGWFIEAQDVRPEPVLVAVACCLFSVAQRRLSIPARELRRHTRTVTGQQTRTDGTVHELQAAHLLAPLESTLSVLSTAMVVLAVGLVIGRL